ncbi:GNAT family N-acetyltransferase, partial [Candidatus Peribacteria bacterium]|nr:GNAT family N-acetyltransferase [Candidatus Peribacteria bacterium]
CEEEVDRVLGDAARIGRRTYHAKVGWLVEENDLWRAQITLAAHANQLRAHFLLGRGEPIAFVLGWNVNSSYHVVAMAYLPEHAKLSPGKHLLLHAIERACADGMDWADYGFGDAEYKRVYGTDSWQESTVHISGRSLRARVAHVLDIAAIRIDQRLRTIAGSSAAARIKKKWRQHLGGP